MTTENPNIGTNVTDPSKVPDVKPGTILSTEAPAALKIAEMKLLPVDRINPAPYNPRKDLKPGDVEYEKIKNSVKFHGLVAPLVVNGFNDVLVGGHQRLKVLKELGYTDIPCAVVNIEDEKVEMALNLALNHAVGTADKAKTAEIVVSLDDGNFPVDLIPFTEDEIEWWVNYQDGDPGADDGAGGSGGVAAGKGVTCPNCGHDFEIGAQG